MELRLSNPLLVFYGNLDEGWMVQYACEDVIDRMIGKTVALDALIPNPVLSE